MKHEKILIRPDNSKIKIWVYFQVISFGTDAGTKWEWGIHKCDPGKRKYLPVVNTNSYEYRQQEFPDGRRRWEVNKMLEFVSKEEVLQAKLELWEKLKPTL